MFEWGWVIGLSVAVVAIAFVVLVVFLCITLCSLQRTLRTSDLLLAETKGVVDDLQGKIHAFDSLFHAASHVGGAFEKKMAQVEEEYEERKRGKQGALAEALEWVLLGVSLWQKMKRRR